MAWTEEEEARISALLHSRVVLRDAMGHYKGEAPLTNLELPSPSPLDYSPNLPTSQGFSIQGKTEILRASSVGPGPAAHYLAKPRLGGFSIGAKMGESNCKNPPIC